MDKKYVAIDSYFETGGNSTYLMNYRPWGDILDELTSRTNNIKYTAITVTFKTQYRDELEEIQLCRMLYVALKTSVEIRAFTLLPDVDNRGNFHYHGVINIRKADMPKVKKRLTRQVGFVKFDYIGNPEGWIAYVLKEKGFTSKEHIEPLDEAIFTIGEKQKYLVSDIGKFQEI